MSDILVLFLALGLAFHLGYSIAEETGASFSEKAKNYFMLNRDV